MQKPVWSPGLRLLHWVLALSVIASFLTHEGGGRWHEVLGYIALGAASLRLVWGLLPAPTEGLGRYARFAQFVRGPSATLAYAKALLARQEPRHIGHNPLGAWMVLALLLTTLAAGLTGWLFITDQFWGVAWVEELHGFFGEAIVPLVLLHWAGVAYTSWRHQENLAAAMLTGNKADAAPGDVD
jgi:cytochrome b